MRFIFAIACVSLLFPASAAHAQSRSSAAKSPQAPAGRAQAAPGGSARGQGAPIRPVGRTQESVNPPADDATGKASLNGGAAVEEKDDILNQQAPPMSPELVKELDQLLEYWSKESEDIKRLEGKHYRIVYDMVFEVEKHSEGEFAYEKADKGRIDITPMDVTEKWTAQRKKDVEATKEAGRKSQIRIKVKTGEPFDLSPEQPETWSCDGQRVYSLDRDKKEAQVAQLPADMQGKNIMDSPLPFLFGMPPEKAKKRFTLFFSGGKFDPKSGRAFLTIYPRLPQDAATWRQADVILDLKEFLPTAVQLLDPAGTKVTVYKFRDYKKNGNDWLGFLKGQNPKTRFTPDLRDYQVHLVDDGSSAVATPGALKPPMQDSLKKSAELKVDENRLVNVVGNLHSNAVIQLERQGLKRIKDDENTTIILEPGPAATRKEDVYTVKSQDPLPGTRIKPGMKVTLVIWTEPKTAKK